MNVQLVKANVIHMQLVSICSQDSAVLAYHPTQEMVHTVVEVRQNPFY